MTLIFFFHMDFLTSLPPCTWSLFQRVWPNHLTPMIMAIMQDKTKQKRTKQNKQTNKTPREKKKEELAGIWRNWNIHVLLAVTVENSIVAPEKVKN